MGLTRLLVGWDLGLFSVSDGASSLMLAPPQCTVVWAVRCEKVGVHKLASCVDLYGVLFIV